MKHLLLSLSLFCCLPALRAATVADGYMITTNNDTLRCKIKVNGLALFDKVAILDSTGSEVVYHAKSKELAGFGFSYEGNKYDYVLIAGEDSSWHFLIRTIKGRRFNLYYAFEKVMVGFGPLHRQDVYLIEAADNRRLTIEGGLSSFFKAKVRAFLNDDAALMELFNNKVHSISDIPDFVRAANG
jgi:hypothetical protein